MSSADVLSSAAAFAQGNENDAWLGYLGCEPE